MGDETTSTDTGRVAGTMLSEWRRLYTVATRIRVLDPWQWVTLGHVFGVQPHGMEEPGFVLFSEQGEPVRRTVSVFRGWTAFRDAIVNRMQDDDSRSPLERTIEESWLRLMFLPRAGLGRTDRAVIKRLALPTDAADEFPAFCSQKIGYFPDRLSPAEVLWLTDILYQAYGMAMRIETAPTLTQERLPRTFFMRLQDADKTWRDAWVDEPPARTEIDVCVDLDCVRRIRQHPTAATVLQADLVLSPLKIKSAADHRSEAVFTLLLVNRDTKAILCCDALQATEGIEPMWAQVTGAVLKGLEQMEAIPAEIEVRSERMLNVLRPLTELLPFKLTRRGKLDALALARDSITELLRVEL